MEKKLYSVPGAIAVFNINEAWQQLKPWRYQKRITSIKKNAPIAEIEDLTVEKAAVKKEDKKPVAAKEKPAAKAKAAPEAGAKPRGRPKAEKSKIKR